MASPGKHQQVSASKPAPSYRTRLTSREMIAEQTMAFHFEKPSGFEYKAGQFIRLTLIEPPETDDEGKGRTFTLASAPYEEDLMVATRIRPTAFKRVLTTMPLGTEVTLGGPFGSFVLHDDPARPAVFLAGGIGITPFRSILSQAAKSKLPHHLLLFYSNHRPDDAAFLEEIRELEEENPNYRLIATMTEMKGSNHPWRGETGHVDKKMLARFIGNLIGPIYYAAGPPAMVTGMREMLNNAGASEDVIRFEEFSGY